MSSRTAHLSDPATGPVAIMQVAPSGDRYSGTIDLAPAPAELRRLFEQFEGAAEGQRGEIARKIDELALDVVFDGGEPLAVENLQVYPSTGRVSFRARHEDNPARGLLDDEMLKG